jgi:hypothetical protein
MPSSQAEGRQSAQNNAGCWGALTPEIQSRRCQNPIEMSPLVLIRTVASMTTFWRYVNAYGRPRSLYVDRASIYEPTRDATVDEALAESGPLTQFGRAMKELDIKLILARSPQAKGRVERRHRVFQDRLVKALRLAGISDLDGANRYLAETFLLELNRQFNVPPKHATDVHRRVPRGVKLHQVLAFQESRVVQNDWTLSWRHRRFQLTEANQELALVRRRVLVCEQLDGTICLLYRGRELAWSEIAERPSRMSSALAPRPVWDASSYAQRRATPGVTTPSARRAEDEKKEENKKPPSPKPRGHFYWAPTFVSDPLVPTFPLEL